MPISMAARIRSSSREMKCRYCIGEGLQWGQDAFVRVVEYNNSKEYWFGDL